MKTQSKNGFTIVELLIVIVVIGILAAITIVSFNGVSNKAKTAKAQSNVAAISKKLELYKTIVGNYPAITKDYATTSDLSSTDASTKLPSNLVIVRGDDDAPDANINDIASVKNGDAGTPQTYLMIVCTNGSGVQTGAKLAYPDYTLPNTAAAVKFVRVGSCN